MIGFQPRVYNFIETEIDHSFYRYPRAEYVYDLNGRNNISNHKYLNSYCNGIRVSV